MPPLAQPSTLPPPSTTVCYECHMNTGGRCWRHQTVTIRPIVIRPSHTFAPYATGVSPYPINGDLITETGPLPADLRWP